MGIKSIEFEDGGLSYRLFFLKEAYDKMRLYVDLCQDEIGWLGYVDKLPNGGFLVTDVFLVDQEVHSTTTELSPTAIMDYYNELDEEGKDNFLSKCKIWGHSHVNMAPTPSGQDDTQGKELSKDVDDFYIRLITNKKGDYHVTFYDKEIKAKIITDEICVYNPENITLRQTIEEEIKQKVKKKAYTTTTGTGTTYSSSNYKSTVPALSAAKDKKGTRGKLTVSKIDIDNIFDSEDYMDMFISTLKV